MNDRAYNVMVAFALVGVALLVGCSMATPASRATNATYGDFTVHLGGNGNKVSFTLGDGALASADSSGSTETQTATPTNTTDVKPDIRYNDAIAGASSASKGVLETLTSASANKILGMMADKTTGTVEVEKTDGTKATVSCADGQCSLCEGGSCSGSACSDGLCSPSVR